MTRIDWPDARRVVRDIYPPIDVFEDIAAPEDWPLLISAAAKTDPALVESVGNLDLVPAARRVSGPGASYLMGPFTHASPDRPSRFSDGQFGVLYVAEDFDTAVHETIHHHARFMTATGQGPGWTSQFRELVLAVRADLEEVSESAALDPVDYSAAQAMGQALRAGGAEGVVYPSVRGEGACAGLFYPDLAALTERGRLLDYHWDGTRVDLVRDVLGGTVFRVL